MRVDVILEWWSGVEGGRLALIMQRVLELVGAIGSGIKSEVRDHSLLSELNRELQRTPLSPDILPAFTRAVFALYDLSNHHSLVHGSRSAGGVAQDELALSIKLTVFKMLASLVVFYSEHGQDRPPPLMRESLEVMVLVARLFLDLDEPADIRPLYPLVRSLHQAAQAVPPEIELLHHLNTIELMRSEVDRGALDVHEMRRELEALFAISRGMPTAAPYRELAEHITLEVVLKLMRTGQAERSRPLRALLPEKLAAVVNQVSGFESRLLDNDLPHLRVSPLYELYLSLKDAPHQVNEERLRAFLSAPENFSDPRVFDVAALSGRLLPLEIWLQTYINTRTRCEGISAAYRCFSFLADRAFAAAPAGDLLQRYQLSLQQLEEYLRVAQLVLLALLLEKRDSQEPIVAVLRRVVRLLAHAVLALYPNPRELREFAEKACLVCAKFGLGDLERAIGCLGFYHEVLMGVACEESYTRFYKNNLMDKNSHIFKTIKLAYEVRSGKALPPEDLEAARREPYLAVLFQKDLKESIVLSIPPQEFARTPEKYEIYFMLSSNLQQDEPDTLRLAQHIEETLIWADLSNLSKLDLRYVSATAAILAKLLENRALSAAVLSRTTVVLLYLTCMTHFSSHLAAVSTGILLNRYSKLMKVLSVSFETLRTLPQGERTACVERLLFLSKGALCWALEELKLQRVAVGGVGGVGGVGSAGGVGGGVGGVCEAGSLLFLDLLVSFVAAHEKAAQQVEFMRYVRFEVACLTDSVNEAELTLERNTTLLRLYCSSRWITRHAKLKILRKLIKEELVSESRQVTLEDLTDLIALADDPREKRMYAEYLLKLFGVQGKTYLMLQSSSNPGAFDFLTEGEEEEGAPEP